MGLPQGYEVGLYAVDFTVTLNITTTTAAAPGNGGLSGPSPPSAPGLDPAPPPPPAPAPATTWEALTLTPSQPLTRNANQSVSARLLGDLEAYNQVPDLSGKYLMIPYTPGRGLSPIVSCSGSRQHLTNARYLNAGTYQHIIFSSRRHEWMLVDSSKVTFTEECDKIGVGYT